MTITCTKVKDLTENWNGNAALYKLSEPVSYYDWSFDEHKTTEYVVISGVNGWAHETYIFPAHENGETINMLEMEGSVKNTTDHSVAIAKAGWVLA